eukprot:3934938-Rhodomonas_salina.1
MENEGAGHLAGALGECTTLGHLNLCKNLIGAEAKDRLRRMSALNISDLREEREVGGRQGVRVGAVEKPEGC